MADLPKIKTSPYNSWVGLKPRCNNPKDTAYKYYGGRGITYSPRWETLTGFWRDMGSSYKAGLSIERLDNNKNYTSQNCIWTTHKAQCNNRSTSRWLTIGGVTKTLSQWSDTTKIKRSTIKQRFYVYGWSIEKSLGMDG